MKNQTFGIELEMFADRAKMAQVVAGHFNSIAVYIGGSYSTYQITDRLGRKWQLMTDSSIRDMNLNTSNRAMQCELVSPILNYSDIEDYQELIRKLRKASAKVNDSCGCHIHIGAKKHTGQTLKNLLNIFYSKNDILYRALDVKQRRAFFCKELNDTLLDRVNELKKPTVKDIIDTWYLTLSTRDRQIHYNDSRYHGLNLHSYERIGTVEFRMFNATLHAGELKSYIQLVLAINNQALTQRSARREKTTKKINHVNYKYTFRTWLLRLQLKGTEFETCRLHMLKHLPGNTVGNSILRAAI